MPEWVKEWVPVLQLLLNAGALIGGAIIWKLYVDNLKAASAVKDATIQSVEKSRDHWREIAEELEKRSPEAVEKSLAERIQIRDAEITRFRADKEFDQIALRALEVKKAELERDLFRTRGFRAMLALEDGYEGDGEPSDAVESAVDETSKRVEVVYIGEVGVDSGQLMVTDPCYIDQEWKREPFSVARDQEHSVDAIFPYSYNGACNATLNGVGHGQLGYAMGHAGAGVAFRTAWGDGGYPVYAEKHDGRIVRVYVNVG
ncbi:hypothetical protein SAMN04515691_2724 [Leifsonia sp. 98AMF]|uniref:DUF4241 domain-containing protein n=1 Tax=unclassified Leifsonia TaxID=2663824 RepID=UPI00087D3214|nr:MULTISPECIES: DUF4241 domain-containing protein [unclassified Leifsonia]SDH21607.1 hypothetical protein SAMN04515690_1292 [Leifsonia sp. 197AMF]SDJ16966.1 hypothetical protein SAMN04515684_2490 [Leifsonia sp. 466MF]SDJ50379.1 hypothetical protein SAMN04515683_0253 [Leifsonia sp. 157MF]SDN38399.1 hypothetical protein SAMN04515686_0674 [Leifsonia sp. 509MF]SEM82760.1 hypothetical protein SAMN04515685_0241 [Leifsonia sp. 467MF]